ncbi:MAG TPA: alpha/beta hydrolase [Thermoanaerobaculia bacterium]|nr:alpha/beta hydrolase [Thermoanaerobaculia bacterium]
MLRLFFLLAKALLFLAGARRRFIRSGPVRLAYYRLGPEKGEPWVLLHGLGANAVSWYPVLRALKGECRLVVPELSMLGGTRGPRHGLGVAEASRVLADLIRRELGSRPVNLAGISLGGWIAVRLTLDRPDLVSRLLLIDAAGYRDQDWDEIERLIRVEDLAGVDRLYGAMFVRPPWLLRRTRPAFLQTFTSRAVRDILEDLSEDDAYDDADLARIQVPTGLIWGECDGLFTVATARAMTAALPHASLEVLPGCAHALHIESPRQLTAAIRRFRRAPTRR